MREAAVSTKGFVGGQTNECKAFWHVIIGRKKEGHMLSHGRRSQDEVLSIRRDTAGFKICGDHRLSSSSISFLSCLDQVKKIPDNELEVR